MPWFLRIAVAVLCPLIAAAANPAYPWCVDYDTSQTLEKRINPPEGFTRVAADSGSFAAWLRGLPMHGRFALVQYYNGVPKWNQGVAHAVIDVDVGDRDLQQCADAVIRLRSEFLHCSKRYDDIRFNFTSGDTAAWRDWIKGMRPSVSGHKVTWSKRAAVDSSYRSFKKYLEIVFSYAGSASLSKELTKVSDVSKMQTGDVFIQGGFPGHAVIVIDMVENSRGERLFLLAQSYMPAQDIHVLRNPNESGLSPWYNLKFDGELKTPEWTFRKSDLKRFAK